MSNVVVFGLEFLIGTLLGEAKELLEDQVFHALAFECKKRQTSNGGCLGVGGTGTYEPTSSSRRSSNGQKNYYVLLLHLIKYGNTTT